LDRSAEINEAVLWDNVHVHAGAQIRRSVVADDVQIPAGAVLENCVVVPRLLVEGKTPPEKALKGHFEGENFIVPL
jgi:ADP-glucose pyrophosphorylase